MDANRFQELSQLSAAQRIAVKGYENYMDAFCASCGEDIRGDGYAIGKFFCSTCAYDNGTDCSVCGCDGGNGAGGYSNCCGGTMGTNIKE
jgi:hypothetical protein